MTDYERLTEQSRGLHIELEGLIERRKKLINELELIDTRRNQVDNAIESNLIQQEMYWSHLNGPSEMEIIDDVFTAYRLNPDMSIVALSESLGVSKYTASATIKRHLTKAS